MAASIILGMLADWRSHRMLLVNRSGSLPNWAFFVTTGGIPSRGDYVSFLPPLHQLVVRHFGARPEVWDKIAYGVPGDVVSRRGSWVSVNGHVVGHLKPRTRFGEPLTPGPIGRIPQRCYYLGTPHPDGFDSRYAEIGFVCTRQIVGIGKPIL